MKVSQYLSRSHVLSGVQAVDRDDAIRASIELLAEAGAIPAKSVRTIIKGVLEREELGSTGIGKGIAIPHVKTRVVEEPVVAYARLAESVDYGATDGARVQSLFFVISPFSSAEDHVAILRWISRIARSDYYAKILANTASADSLHDLFLEIDEQS